MFNLKKLNKSHRVTKLLVCSSALLMAFGLNSFSVNAKSHQPWWAVDTSNTYHPHHHYHHYRHAHHHSMRRHHRRYGYRHHRRNKHVYHHYRHHNKVRRHAAKHLSRWDNEYNNLTIDEANYNIDSDMRNDLKKHTPDLMKHLNQLSLHKLYELDYHGFHLDNPDEQKIEARYNYLKNVKKQNQQKQWSGLLKQTLAKDGNTKFARETANDEFNDINKARQAKGLHPLLHNPYLQEVANMRVKQAWKAENMDIMNKYNDYLNDYSGKNNGRDADNLAHGMDWHESSSDDARKLHVANKLGVISGLDSIGENEASNDVTKEPQLFDSDASGDPAFSEYDNTPKHVAHNHVYDMLHYDLASHNGHAQNIYANCKYLATASYQRDESWQAPQSTVQEYY